MNQQKLARAFYRKLLGLYPRRFKEQFGESMSQTFHDLWQEKARTKQELFGFVLWLFLETTLGIVKEHLVSIKEIPPMNHSLATARSSAMIGFLIVLPFILLELAFVLLKRLTFGLRDALDSVVLFGILWLGLSAITLMVLPIARTLGAGNRSSADLTPSLRNSIFTNPTSAALISLLLALPFVTFFVLLLLNIEPPFAQLLNNANPDQPSLAAMLIPLGAFLLLVAAGLVARTPVVQTLQAGGGLLAHPVNLLLTLVMLSLLTLVVVGLSVDQFPCWIGAPNCD